MTELWSLPETDLERAVVSDPDWIAGATWGVPRPGHPEGSVAKHLLEVLDNVDSVALDAADRQRLRLVALTHDHFKYQVDRSQDRTGENHHGMLARRFAERYIDDAVVLDVIELHDEAFNTWKAGDRSGKWDKAETRAEKLIVRLGDSLPFYLRFFEADNQTGDKTSEPVDWFRAYAGTVALHNALLRTVETWPDRLGPLPKWVDVWYRSVGMPPTGDQ